MNKDLLGMDNFEDDDYEKVDPAGYGKRPSDGG